MIASYTDPITGQDRAARGMRSRCVREGITGYAGDDG